MLTQFELKDFQNAYLGTLLELLDENEELQDSNIYDFADEAIDRFNEDILNPFLDACISANINLVYSARNFSIKSLASDLCLTCSGYGTSFLDREIYSNQETILNSIAENIPFYYAVKGADGKLYLE